MANEAFEEILAALREFASGVEAFSLLGDFCVGMISEKLPRYNWAGFYMLDPDDENVLVLGPFRGSPTEHVRIPVNKGICGAAVAQGEPVIVNDVSKDSRYLACSIETKAEIVVPIRRNGRVVGEIDVDSHTRNAFGPEDRWFLEECAAIISQALERQQERSHV